MEVKGHLRVVGKAWTPLRPHDACHAKGQGPSKKVKASRRAMRLKPTDPELCWDGSDAVIYFELPKGSFATACISELIDLSVTENDEDSVE